MGSKITQIGRPKHVLELPRKPESDGSSVSKMKVDRREEPPISGVTGEVGGTISGECVLVPEGEYELRYLYYETNNCFGTPRVVVHFAIIWPEDHAGLPLERFYNVERMDGPPEKHGNFMAKRRGDLTREYALITGPIRRHDRLSFAPFKGKRIVGQAITVTKDYLHRPLPKDEHYSKIGCIVRVLPAEEC